MSKLRKEKLVSETFISKWIFYVQNIRRNITEGMREKYAHMIDNAISHGFALHGKLEDIIDSTVDDEGYMQQINGFYEEAPKECRIFWEKILPCYLQLPDLAKASILCSSYIGRSKLNNKESNRNQMLKTSILHRNQIVEINMPLVVKTVNSRFAVWDLTSLATGS